MIYRGHVENGVVLLDENVQLPSGTKVKIEPVEPSGTRPDEGDGATVYERLKPFIGSAKGLPPDASKHIDDFLYGRDNS